jgi:hypothetical protein
MQAGLLDVEDDMGIPPAFGAAIMLHHQVVRADGPARRGDGAGLIEQPGDADLDRGAGRGPGRRVRDVPAGRDRLGIGRRAAAGRRGVERDRPAGREDRRSVRGRLTRAGRGPGGQDRGGIRRLGLAWRAGPDAGRYGRRLRVG